MDDARIPWWLVLLLGVGVAGLAVWQSSRWKLQVRMGAGALALVYLALLAFAIGGDPRPVAAMRAWQISDLPVFGLCGLSLTAAVLLIGRPSFRGQLVWFGVLTFANAGICVAVGIIGIASILLAMGVAVMILLVKECRNGHGLTAAELWPTAITESIESPYLPWLAGGTGLVMAVALIGTTYYGLHAESARATPTRRHSALPSRARIRTVLNIQPDEERSTGLIDQAFGRRADVAVLLAVLVFVSLASAISTRSRSAC